MKALNFTLTVLFIMLSYSLVTAQRMLQTEEYDFEKINVRDDKPFALARIELDIPTYGKVIARMEGDCISTMGDVITFGVSNSASWLPNFGNMGIRLYDSLRNNNRYFHSMSFDVLPGKHTFSAYAHNWTDRNGDGSISVKGNFIVEFIPESENEIRHTFKNLSVYPFNINEDLKLVDSISITTDKPAKILFSFDGRFYSRTDTEVMFVLNDYEGMNNDAEIFNVHIPHISRLHSFSRQMVREVQPGTHRFFVMCRKIKGNMNDTENAVYATLRATVFYDDDTQEAVMLEKYDGSVSTAGLIHNTGEISWTVPAKGKILVGYSGVTELNADEKMNINIAVIGQNLSKTENTVVQTLHPNDVQSFFSMQRVFDVEKGDLKINAFTIPEGITTSTQFKGDLLLKYIADPVVSSIDEQKSTPTLLDVFPNPASDYVQIHFKTHENAGNVRLILRDITGNLIESIADENLSSGRLNISHLPEGLYIIEVENGKSILTKKFIKIN